jgi:hypothetical protein
MPSARTATEPSCSTPASTEKDCRLAYLKGQMVITELYAKYWTTSAQVLNKPDDLNVAKMHIRHYHDMLDTQDALLRDKEPL